MNKLKLAILAIVIAIGTYGFANSDSVVNPEKESVELHVYHYDSVNQDGKIIFSPGEPGSNDCSSGLKPCRFESTQELTSPMSASEIQSKAIVTDWRP
ncbi:hypothetical protein J1D01_03075 [Seonamhaeicola sp. NFXS20]|uniref:hypothetical protein n=1 Tax=Seonamhaeicola sp. NFXS20 TaxID=2816959 RepID=UPI003B8B76FE